MLLGAKIRDKIQWCCSLSFLLSVVFGVVLVIILHLKVSSELDEARCKCVCPHNLNTTDTFNTTVFLQPVSDATLCICESIVPLSSELLCLQCECTFETRNKLLLEFIIISVVVVICLMLIYTIIRTVYQVVNKIVPTHGYQSLNSNNIDNEGESIESVTNMSRFRSAFRSRIAHDRRLGYTS